MGSLWRRLGHPVASTFMIDHVGFVGQRQEGLIGRGSSRQGFQERWLYVWVRHPMMLGLLIVFFAAPSMSTGHLLLAIMAAAYILVGLRFEERALERELGAACRNYVERVPLLVPRIPARARTASTRPLP